jgi:hypothetical protein
MTVRPRLLNSRGVARALERFYPPPLRDAGIGGTVVVWFYIDTEVGTATTRVPPHPPPCQCSMCSAWVGR